MGWTYTADVLQKTPEHGLSSPCSLVPAGGGGVARGGWGVAVPWSRAAGRASRAAGGVRKKSVSVSVPGAEMRLNEDETDQQSRCRSFTVPRTNAHLRTAGLCFFLPSLDSAPSRMYVLPPLNWHDQGQGNGANDRRGLMAIGVPGTENLGVVDCRHSGFVVALLEKSRAIFFGVRPVGVRRVRLPEQPGKYRQTIKRLCVL